MMKMRSFAVIEREDRNETLKKYPNLSRIAGIDKLIEPYKGCEMKFHNVTGVKISIPGGFEGSKVKRAYKRGVRDYGYVLSKEYNINYNPFFHHSCLVRALDFFSISLGCDIRLNEVIIADASTIEGKNAFRLLLPIARRIVLVTERKHELLEEVEYGMIRYGSSIALVEDPVKAAERADIVILSSLNKDHKYLAELDRPMLYFRFINPPGSRWWFDDVDIAFNDNEFGTIYAQGYIDVNEKGLLWHNAEREGFRIKNIKRGKDTIIER